MALDPQLFNGAQIHSSYPMQQQLGNNIRVPHEYTGSSDQMKMDAGWDASRPNLPDLQDKQHVSISLRIT